MPHETPCCLFRCAGRPLGVAVDVVSEVVEVASLVRISHCPPQVLGLCSYHRDVVPVVSLSHGSSADPARGRAFLPVRGGTQPLLILQTERSFWGVPVDPDGTFITSERPQRHSPGKSDDGLVTVGLVVHDGRGHAVLDAAATWRELRESIVAWYGRFAQSPWHSRNEKPAFA